MPSLSSIEETITNLIKRITLHLESSRAISEFFREISLPESVVKDSLNKNTCFLEEKLVAPIETTNISGLRVLGVDGGMQIRSLSGFDIIMVRSIGTMFYHKPDSVVASYFPSKTPDPDILIIPSLSTREEVDRLATLKRLQSEYETMKVAIKNMHPNIALLDGSVLPLESDRPQNPSLVNEYRHTIKIFTELLIEAEKNQTTLVGVVKDTRSRLFVQLLSTLVPILLKLGLAKDLLNTDYRSVFRTSTDITFINNLTHRQERTSIIREKTHIPELNISVIRDVTYLKPVPFDIPLRIEVLHRTPENTFLAKRTAQIIQAISGSNPAYAMPNVLMEADARVRISNEEMDLIVDSILTRAGLKFIGGEKRRSRSPF